MKLLINHQTMYHYEAWAYHGVQYLRMTPKTTPVQQVVNWNLAAVGEFHHQADGFDNIWSTLTINEPHHHMMIMAQGQVDIDDKAAYLIDPQQPNALFLTPTPLTTVDEALIDFTKTYLTDLTQAGLIRLAEAILEKIPYTPGSTDVMTTAAHAFAQGQGVCQDHTNVMLACARHSGLPARYVGGYLYTNSDTHLASHAWAEVWLNGAWYSFDISNQLFSPSHHVQVAVGRDYLDTAPIRGVRSGGGEERMQALVQVLPL